MRHSLSCCKAPCGVAWLHVVEDWCKLIQLKAQEFSLLTAEAQKTAFHHTYQQNKTKMKKIIKPKLSLKKKKNPFTSPHAWS